MRRLLAPLHDILVLIHGPPAGMATGLVLLEVGADAWSTTLGSGSVAIVLILIRHFATAGERRERERNVAAAVRGILDRHLILTRIDPVGVGDSMTLRH